MLDLTTTSLGPRQIEPLPVYKLRNCFEALDLATYPKVRYLEICIGSSLDFEGEDPRVYARYALAIMQRLGALQVLALRIRYDLTLTLPSWTRYFLEALANMNTPLTVRLAYNPANLSGLPHPMGRSIPSLLAVLAILETVKLDHLHLQFEDTSSNAFFVDRAPLQLNSIILRGMPHRNGSAA